MEHAKRHIVLYRIIRLILYPFSGWIFRIKSEKANRIQGPCLILANHNINVDPILISRSFPHHMYFLASEHVLSWGWRSVVIDWVAGPVSKLKSTADAGAVKDVMRRIRKGHSICIFAEGHRSFNGVTHPIAPATGKLVKVCQTTLVTYRFEGGYFTSPRWAAKNRKGEMKGYVVGVYPFEELKHMSDKEINELIQRDLHEDAYARQKETPIAYRGKNLAEWLEITLYMCPSCGEIGTLRSKGNDFFCTACSLCSTIDEYGILHGKNLPYHTVTDWDNWQVEEMAGVAQQLGTKKAFSDPGQMLYLMDPVSHKRIQLAMGTLCLYGDRITLGEYVFPFEEIIDMNVHGKQSIVFSSGNAHYEIKSKFPRSARKYVVLYKYLTGNGDVRRV